MFLTRLFGSGNKKFNSSKSIPSLNREKLFHPKKLMIGGAILTVIGIGSILAAYFLNPGFHSLFDHSFSYLKYGDLSLRKSFLYIALPMAVAGSMFCITVYYYRKYKKEMSQSLESKSFRQFMAEELKLIMQKARENPLPVTIGLSFLTMCVGLIVIFGTTHTFHPLSDQLHFWKDFTIMSSVTVGLIVTIALSAIGYHKYLQYKNQSMPLTSVFEED